MDNRPRQRGLEAFFVLCCQVSLPSFVVELRIITLQQTRLEGLQGPATSVSWSPDGKLVAACSPSDTKLHIWSPASQVLVFKVETPCNLFSKFPVSTLSDNLSCRYVRWFTEGAVVESLLPVGVQTSEVFSLPHRHRSSGSGKPRLDIDVGTKLDILFSKGWTCDRWSVGSGRVAAAAWAPDSLQLVFATTEEPVLYCLSFQVQMYSFRD